MDIVQDFSLSVDEIQIRLPHCYDATKSDDAEKILNYYQKNRDFLEPWEPKRPASFFTLCGWQHRLKQLAKLQEYKLAFYFLIFADDKESELLGIIIYSNVAYYPSYSANVGYSLAKHAQSKGIMTKSLMATNQWLFKECNLHRINAAYMPKNLRSAKVLNAAGFVMEGKARAYLMINGKWEDHILTSLINPYWQRG